MVFPPGLGADRLNQKKVKTSLEFIRNLGDTGLVRLSLVLEILGHKFRDGSLLFITLSLSLSCVYFVILCLLSTVYLSMTSFKNA